MAYSSFPTEMVTLLNSYTLYGKRQFNGIDKRSRDVNLYNLLGIVKKCLADSRQENSSLYQYMRSLGNHPVTTHLECYDFFKKVIDQAKGLGVLRMTQIMSPSQIRVLSMQVENHSLEKVWPKMCEAIDPTLDRTLNAPSIRAFLKSNPVLLQQVTDLNLSELKLKILPPEIGLFTSLHSLNIAENELKQLPPEIVKLTQLQHLYLSKNRIEKLPPEIQHLTTLITLDLNENQISELPAEIACLTSLVTLLAENNRMVGLPAELGRLQSLQALDVSGNQLLSLPNELWQLNTLNILRASRNQIAEISPLLGQLNQLLELKLDNNQIAALPPSIGQLGALSSFRIEANRLRSLPRQIVQLGSLIKLDASQNQIQELSFQTLLPGNLPVLTTLLLKENKLQTLPPQLGHLTGLEELDASQNEICSLPEEMGQLTALKRLNLSSNFMETLPEGIGGMTGLKWLKLDGNRLEELPEEIGNLSALEDLRVNDNKLFSLPSSLQNLKELRSLLLAKNQFNMIPEVIRALQKNLCTLDIQDNPIQSFGPFLSWLTPSKDRIPFTLLYHLSKKDFFEKHVKEDVAESSSHFQESLNKNVRENGSDFQSAFLNAIVEHYPENIRAVIRNSLLDPQQLDAFKESILNQGFLNFSLTPFSYTRLRASSPVFDKWEQGNVLENMSVLDEGFIDKLKLYLRRHPQRNEIFRAVYFLSGSPATQNLQWGENNAFRDLEVLMMAIDIVDNDVVRLGKTPTQ